MHTLRIDHPGLMMLVRVILAIIAFGLLANVLAAADAPATYKAKCAVCHGPDGSGDTPMGKKMALRDLRSTEVRKQTDAQLTAIITDGKNKMPKFGDKLSAAEVSALVKHIRALK